MISSSVEDGGFADERSAVAVVGMAGRFPGASSVEELWELLLDGGEGIGQFERDDLRRAGVAGHTIDGPGFVAAKGALDDIAGFDAHLFGYSAAEAALLDPQQRIFLETAWTALEDAACDPDRFDGAIGVFGGALLSTYLIRNLLPHAELASPDRLPMLFQANQPDQLAARVAYKLNLRGPAMAIQTACSTSLVAVHVAAQSLISGECDMALAGGVAVTVPRIDGYTYVEGGVNSPDGRCRPFDDAANGTVFGNAAGIVVLRRLADALASGDRIRAVIVGSAVNNDGNDRAGYTAPSLRGQSSVIREALSVAGLASSDIGFVETHGTGTPLGDPIEFAALCDAYTTDGDSQPRKPWCALGAMKGNVGHLDTAAGIAGLIKAVLAVERGVIPPNRHDGGRNHRLAIQDSPFYFPQERTPWRSTTPRRAAVSAFGIGGTNAHVVIQAPPARPVTSRAEPAAVALLAMSAATTTSLQALSQSIADHLEAAPDSLAAVASTLRRGRRELPHRRCVAASSASEAIELLRRRPTPARAPRAGRPRQLIFVLPGQGSQFVGMGRELYERHLAYRYALDECAAAVDSRRGGSMIDAIWAGSAEDLARTELTQPAVFSVSYALAALWKSWGIEADGYLGHSLGEITAACLAGVWELADALHIVSVRGQLQAATPPGAMLAVALGADEAALHAARLDLDLAAINGPRAATISGSRSAIAQASDYFTARGIGWLPLEVSRAFHSRLCDEALAPFRDVLASVAARPPARPFLSNVTGTWITPEQAVEPEYWMRHMREPVRFGDDLATVRDAPFEVTAVEVGPGSTLSGFARAVLGAASVTTAPIPATARPCVEQAAAQLWEQGMTLDWSGVDPDTTTIALPTYPFEHHPYWIDPPPPQNEPAVSEGPTVDGGPHAVLGAVGWVEYAGVAPVDSADSVGDRSTHARRLTWLILADRQHRVQPIADALAARGHIVTTVHPGTALRRISRGNYEIDPSDADSYVELVRSLRGLVRTPNAILHAWSLAEESDLDEDTGFLSVARLVRALSVEGVVHDVRAIALTAGAFAIDAQDVVTPHAAMTGAGALGVARDVANIHWTHVDLSRPADAPPDAAGAADAVLGLDRDVAGPLAIRGGRAFRREVRALPEPPVRRRQRLPTGAVVVIAGGTGGLGRSFAKYLAGACAARVVALSRRDAATPSDTLAAAIKQHGGELFLLPADITDRAQVEAAFAQTRSRFGPIDCLVHAAGIPAGGSVERRTDDELRAVLAPKVSGTINLLASLHDDEAPLVLLCSSIATLCPPYGQADYVAANAYLDAVAQQVSRTQQRQVTSVAWDSWADVGMAVDTAIPDNLRSVRDELLAGALTREQGVRAFATLLDGDQPHVVVARVGTPVGADGQLLLRARDTVVTTSIASPRPDLAVPYRAPETETEERVARIFGSVLGLTDVGADDDFLSLGGHSLMAAQLVAQLRATFEIDVPVRIFFEAATVASVAEEIEEGILARLGRP